MSDVPDTQRKSRCPVCKKDSVFESRPFCSKRCKDIDLARWLGDGYAIPGGSGEADEESDDPGGRGYDPKR